MPESRSFLEMFPCDVPVAVETGDWDPDAGDFSLCLIERMGIADIQIIQDGVTVARYAMERSEGNPIREALVLLEKYRGLRLEADRLAA